MHTRTLLLVEDDENDIFFMRRALKLAEVKNPLQVVQDGQRAVDYLRGVGEYSDRSKYPIPCLILLDLQLPFVPGMEVLNWLRADSDLKTLNVAILTSSREDMDIHRAYRLGANAYLVKPPDSSELLEMAKAIRDFWLRQNQPPPQSEPVGTSSSL